MEFGTKVLHGYDMIDSVTGASSIPIYQASTFHQKDISKVQEYTYSRFANPTRSALESAVASLENCQYGVAYSSGMAAISAVFLTFSKGDHLVVCKDVYGGTFNLIKILTKRFGFEVSYVDSSDLLAWENAIKENTKGFYLETPSNPLLTITDIKSVCDIAKKHNIITMIDNTFMSPQLQNPIHLGVDIVIHSATKFLNGHSDVVLGVVVTDKKELYEELKTQQITFGSLAAVQDCWLVMRGIKTMNLRMIQSSNSALAIAELLESHAKVKKVYYPGLQSHKGYDIQMKQAKNGGAVLSFELESAKAVKTFFDNIRLPIVAVSLGGVESILSYPVTMSHACVPEADRLKQGITDGLIRLSVGIEDTNDLIDDLMNALSKV